MNVWEKFGPYRKSEMVIDKLVFSGFICPDGLAINIEDEIVGALADDKRTFFYLIHKRTDDGMCVIPQFKEPILPHSMSYDDHGNPTFGMTKDGRVITLDGTLVATSERGDRIFHQPELRTQDYLEHEGKLLLHLPMPVYSMSIRYRNGLPSQALARDNQTVFFFREKSYYVIPEDDLEKLLEK